MKRHLRLSFPLMILSDPAKQQRLVVARAVGVLGSAPDRAVVFLGAAQGSLVDWLASRRKGAGR